MVNNEFHLVGVALSNFEDISNNQYKSYLLTLEVEKTNSSTIEIVVQIYGTNRKINTNEVVLGKTVVINGYIDSFLSKENKILMKLIAQNIYIIDRDKNKGAYIYSIDDNEAMC